MSGSQPRESKPLGIQAFFEASMTSILLFTFINALAPPRPPWWSIKVAWGLVALGWLIALLGVVNRWATVAVEAAAVVFALANAGIYWVRRRRWRRRRDAIFGPLATAPLADAVRRLQGRD